MIRVTRDGLRTATGEDIDGMIDRLERLAADLRALRDGADPAALAESATILDQWMEHLMPIPCLVGGATAHPTLPGGGRLIRTSDLWVMAEDYGCAARCLGGIVLAGRSRPRRRTPEEAAYG